MKIVSCFSALRELEPLARAGADEFYTAAEGLLPFSSGTLPPEHLPRAVKEAHRLGRRISIAVNTLLATATVRQLAAIERLAAAGERAVARAELEAFRKAYPDYPLPQGMEKLLAP